MKRFTLILPKHIGLMLVAVTMSASAFADVFIAGSSGDFTSSSTWVGGVVPETELVTDQIIIPSGITVNLNSNITINGALASMAVDGSMTTSNASTITLNLGELTGAGSIVVNAINVNAAPTFSFTGDLTVNTLNSALGFQSSADIVVNQSLNLIAGTLSLVSGGSLNMSANGTITISGGLLSVGSGGSLALVNDYHVEYVGGSALAGIELSGSELQDVTVDVTPGSSVTLTTDLTVAGTLALTNGILVLAGNDLSVNGQVEAGGNGTVTSTVLSDISLNGPDGTIGTITFTNASATVNDLTVNVGSGNSGRINGFLTVSGTLQLNSGSLNFYDTDLTVDGSISGSGTLSANGGSDLTIESIVGATTALDFVTGGQILNDLTISVGSGVAVTMASDLTVQGALTLGGGSNLNLNGRSLTLDPASSLAGSGSFVATAAADLTIHTIGGISALRVMGSIGDFTVNSVNGNVALGADLMVDGMLYLQSGMLDLNNRDLDINGNINIIGNGTISSTAASDIAVTGSMSPNGVLSFTAGANTVGVFSVDIANNGMVGIGTDLHVGNTLEFVSGRLNARSNMVTIDAGGQITGQGAGTYVITDVDGSLEQSITAGGSTAVNFPIGTVQNYAPANISLAAGSTSGRVDIGVVPGVMANGTAGADLAVDQALVNATWNIASSVSSNFDLNLQVMWSGSMEVNGFNRSASYVSHHIDGAWDAHVLANATVESGGMYSMQRDGITELSPFAVFDETTMTGIDDLTVENMFDVYPNPAIENIVVRNTMTIGEAVNMEVYNANGQLMGSYRLNDVSTTISVNDLTPGNYIIRFFNASMNSTESFIKM